MVSSQPLTPMRMEKWHSPSGVTARYAPPPGLRQMRRCPKYGPNTTLTTSDTLPRKRQSTASLLLNSCVSLSVSMVIFHTLMLWSGTKSWAGVRVIDSSCICNMCFTMSYFQLHLSFIRMHMNPVCGWKNGGRATVWKLNLYNEAPNSPNATSELVENHTGL